MAVIIFTNAYITVNGVDLSDHGTKITTIDNRNEVDVTAFSSNGYVQVAKGLGNAEVDIDFLQDFAAGKTHATLSALIGSTTGVAVEVRPTNAARSATNPAILLASGLLFTYNGLDSQVGDAAKITAVFKNAPGGAGITYPTS